MEMLAEALDSTQRGGKDADSSTDGSAEVDWSAVPRYTTVQCVPVSLKPVPKSSPWGQPYRMSIGIASHSVSQHSCDMMCCGLAEMQQQMRHMPVARVTRAHTTCASGGRTR